MTFYGLISGSNICNICLKYCCVYRKPGVLQYTFQYTHMQSAASKPSVVLMDGFFRCWCPAQVLVPVLSRSGKGGGPGSHVGLRRSSSSAAAGVVSLAIYGFN